MNGWRTVSRTRPASVAGRSRQTMPVRAALARALPAVLLALSGGWAGATVGAMAGAIAATAAHAQPAPPAGAPEGPIPMLVPGQKLKPGEVVIVPPAEVERRAAEQAAIAAEKAAAEKTEKARAAAAKRPGSQWYRGNLITLNASEPKAGFKALWQFERTAGNDIRLTLDEQRRAGPQRGTVMIIGQQALLTRDMTLVRAGTLMPAVDGPTLLLNLTLRMLERGVPEGPQSVRRERAVSIRDQTQPIQVDTPSARGVFLAPWQLTGKVVRRGEAIEFDLLLVSRSRTDPNGTHNTVLRGSWRHEEKKPPVLGDELPLAGWALHAVAGVPKEVNRQQTVVFEAIPRQGFDTLGALRKAIEAGWPGQPDAVFHRK